MMVIMVLNRMQKLDYDLDIEPEKFCHRASFLFNYIGRYTYYIMCQKVHSIITIILLIALKWSGFVKKCESFLF